MAEQEPPSQEQLYRRQKVEQLRRLLGPGMPKTFTWCKIDGTKRFFNGFGPAEVPNVIEYSAPKEEAQRLREDAVRRTLREIITS